MPTMDQVAWSNANVTVGGETTPFPRGALLPEPGTPEEAAERNILRLGGAIRTVEVVYTAEELAGQARARGETTAIREAALDVDSSLPLAQQMPGTTEPGLPTMTEPSGAPVVIGDEDLRAEHEQAAQDAAMRQDASLKAPPRASGSKAEWVDFAVESRGADRAEAEAMTRDQLVSAFRSPLGGAPIAPEVEGEAQILDAQVREDGTAAESAATADAPEGEAAADPEASGLPEQS